jgi:hypothetical protein
MHKRWYLEGQFDCPDLKYDLEESGDSGWEIVCAREKDSK